MKALVHILASRARGSGGATGARRRRLLRLMLGAAGAVAASIVLVGSGSARPAPAASVSVVCDSGVRSATVTIQLLASADDQTPVGGPADFSCGPESPSGAARVKGRIPASAAYGRIGATVVETEAAGTGTCVYDAAPPLRADCQISGGGPLVHVTVR